MQVKKYILHSLSAILVLNLVCDVNFRVKMGCVLSMLCRRATLPKDSLWRGHVQVSLSTITCTCWTCK